MGQTATDICITITTANINTSSGKWVVGVTVVDDKRVMFIRIVTHQKGIAKGISDSARQFPCSILTLYVDHIHREGRALS
jgi:hypothetical protein